MNTTPCSDDQVVSISGMRELFEHWLVEVGQDEQRASKDYAAFDLFLAGALAMLPADQREAVKAEYARQEFWKSFRRIRAIKSRQPGYNPRHNCLMNWSRTPPVELSKYPPRPHDYSNALHQSDVELFERTYRSPTAEEAVRPVWRPEHGGWATIKYNPEMRDIYEDEGATRLADALAFEQQMEQRPDPSKIYGRNHHLLILDDPLFGFDLNTVSADYLPKQTREEILQHVKHLNTVMPHIAHGVNKDEDK